MLTAASQAGRIRVRRLGRIEPGFTATHHQPSSHGGRQARLRAAALSQAGENIQKRRIPGKLSCRRRPLGWESRQAAQAARESNRPLEEADSHTATEANHQVDPKFASSRPGTTSYQLQQQQRQDGREMVSSTRPSAFKQPLEGRPARRHLCLPPRGVTTVGPVPSTIALTRRQRPVSPASPVGRQAGRQGGARQQAHQHDPQPPPAVAPAGAVELEAAIKGAPGLDQQPTTGFEGAGPAERG